MFMRKMLVVTLIPFLSLALAAQEKTSSQAKLPEVVHKALMARWPGAEIEEVEVEVKGGRKYYEVEMEQGEYEATLSLDEAGSLLEIEQEVSSLPEAVRRALHGRHASARLVEAEWVQRFHYEIDAIVAGKETEIRLRPDGSSPQKHHSLETDMSQLPSAIRSVLKSKIGDAEVTEIDVESAVLEDVFEFEYKTMGKVASLSVTRSGELVEMELEVDQDGLPAAVKAAWEKHEGAQFKAAELVESFTYEVTLQVGKRRIEYLLSPAGAILGAEMKPKRGDEEDEAHDEDSDDDDKADHDIDEDDDRDADEHDEDEDN